MRRAARFGDAFYVDDGSDNVAPTSAYYIETVDAAGFEFELFSEIAPATTEAELSATVGSGGRRGQRRLRCNTTSSVSGTATVLSNGLAPVPEPTGALVFAIGFATIAARCRSKARRA